jgi:hypothetical protein
MESEQILADLTKPGYSVSSYLKSIQPGLRNAVSGGCSYRYLSYLLSSHTGVKISPDAIENSLLTSEEKKARHEERIIARKKKIDDMTPDEKAVWESKQANIAAKKAAKNPTENPVKNSSKI